MPNSKVLPTLIVLLLASALLTACGGSDGDGSTDAAAPTPARTTTTPLEESGEVTGDKRGAMGADRPGGEPATADDEPGSSAPGKPAPLTTDPTSIRGARVTTTGAVQTLPPSESSQVEAMENSYSSIKAFGSEAEGPEATDITYALLQYLNAKAEGDWPTACARLYSVLRGNLEKEGRGCSDTYGTLISRIPAASRAEAATIDVASVRRGENNRAFVIYKTPATLSADMPMYLEGDVWTVGALEAYVLTPEQLEAGK